MARSRRVVSYFRVPTGLRGPAARAALEEATARTRDHARRRGLVVLEPFVEAARAPERPELARALDRCSEAGAALLVPDLASLGGDLVFLDALLEASVPLHSADGRPSGRTTLRLLADVARHAQSEASTRSREALRAARARGVRLGSPTPEKGSRAGVAALRARADAHAEAVAPALAELLLSNPGASLRDLAEGLEALGVPTPRRGRWGPSAVRNALLRAGLTRAPTR